MIALPQPGSQHRSVLPPGRDAAGWYGALHPEIASHLTPAHAAVLGRPVPGGEGTGARPGETAWMADGARTRRLADLPAEDREALLAHLRSVLSDVRRLAESRAAPAVAEAWPALREVPDLACVHAVDGRPVLAAWGHAGPRMGVLAHLDDGVPWRAPVKQPWVPWAAALGALAVLGLAAGLLVPAFGSSLAPAPAACTAAPGQLALLRDQAAEEERGRDLRARLAQLAEETGRRQLQCPLPQRAEAAPAPPAAPPPAPPRRADLPEEAWRRRDVTMFEGCWNRVTNMSVRDIRSGDVSRVRSWRLCFDRQGQGRQTVVLEDGRQCENPMSVAFQDDTAVMRDVERCRWADGALLLGEIRCRRTSDDEADCGRRDLQGPDPNRIVPGRFRR